MPLVKVLTLPEDRERAEVEHMQRRCSLRTTEPQGPLGEIVRVDNFKS